MEKKILVLGAPLKERIWGSSYFKDELKMTNSNEPIGEMWSCSGYPGDESVILNGYFKNMSLSEVFLNNKELFNNSRSDKFPILVKLIATRDMLSVQVHPDDDFARKYENDLGKTEGWLILDTKDDSNIVIGHNANNKEELVNYVNNDDFNSLLRSVKPKKGDFYPIPTGTIHALGKNLVLLEVQQSSNVTYRFYDYHRKDKNGNERELHIAKAVAVTSYKPYNEVIHNAYRENINTLWDNEYFTVKYYDIDGSTTINNNHKYAIISVASGEVMINNNKLTLGRSAIATSLNESFTIEGKGSVVITYSKE